VFLKIKIPVLAVWLSLLLAVSAHASDAASHRQVRDQLGRTVEIPVNPKRVVSLAPSITEIIFALNLEHLLVGVTRFSDFPPAARDLPKVGSYVQLDLERIVSLNPDLCIAVKDGNPKRVVSRLESLGVPLYAVDPRNIPTVLETITEIGKLFSRESMANQLATQMGQRIDNVKKTVSAASSRPGVFFQIGVSPIVSVGTDTFIHELVELAGGSNLTAGPIPYPRYSREQVIALAPDIFIITSMARGEVFDKVKQQWQQWPDMPAVRNNRILLVDSDLYDRASPRLVDGLEQLARLVHPHLFGENP
jgi:cobalamin transport system substrate-binding protein